MTVFLVDLEAVETRYTGQWKSHVPDLLRKEGHDVTIISGPSDIPSATHLALFLTLAALTYTKPVKWNKWEGFLLKVESIAVITFCLLTLGIPVLLTLGIWQNCLV